LQINIGVLVFFSFQSQLILLSDLITSKQIEFLYLCGRQCLDQNIELRFWTK